jgi:hypothetical protein
MFPFCCVFGRSSLWCLVWYYNAALCRPIAAKAFDRDDVACEGSDIDERPSVRWLAKKEMRSVKGFHSRLWRCNVRREALCRSRYAKSRRDACVSITAVVCAKTHKSSSLIISVFVGTVCRLNFLLTGRVLTEDKFSRRRSDGSAQKTRKRS